MRYKFIPLFILLTALAVRMYRINELGTQSDEGVHIFVSERLASGDVLYVDLFENRVPGVEWTQALLFRFLEPSVFSGRVLALGMTAITIAALFPAGKVFYDLLADTNRRHRAYRHMSGWLAAALFAFAPLPIFWSRFVMLEHWQSAAAILSVTCALFGVKHSNAKWWFAAGILAGCTVLAKQSGALVVAAIGLYLVLMWLTGHKQIPSVAIRPWSAGFLMPLLGMLAILVVQDSLKGFFDNVSGSDILEPFLHLAQNITATGLWSARWPVLLMAAVGGLAMILARRIRAWLVPLWVATEFGALLLATELDLGWGGFSHYVIPATVALCLLVGGTAIWLWKERTRQATFILPAMGLGLALLAILPGWLDDLDYAIRRSDYPLPDRSTEIRIGRALSTVTDNEEKVLVMANSIFYHLADRPPANFFFQWPSYLNDSHLADDAEQNLKKALENPEVGAVLVSRVHLDELMPATAVSALWQRWTPVAVLPYPYQRDAVLFMPKLDAVQQVGKPLAQFEGGIALDSVETETFGDDVLLVRLNWNALEQPDDSLIAFVHLNDVDGDLIAQHDGVPVAGFRPTFTWVAGETIHDYHWIDLSLVEVDDYYLSIGLYNAQTGERKQLSGELVGLDTYSITVKRSEP